MSGGIRYKATDAAARHLRDLNDRFGSLYLAAAAYNAGSGRVSRGLRRLPDDDDRDGLASDATFFRLYDTKLLRRETKDYVPKLIAAAAHREGAGRYGFTVTPSEPMRLRLDRRPDDDRSRRHRPPGRHDARRGARDEPAVPPAHDAAGSGFGRSDPGRPRSDHRRRVCRASADRRVTFVEHVVARGETMGGIARRYRVSQSMLAAANPKVKPTRLRVGQMLIVPTGGGISTSMARRMAAPTAPAGTEHLGLPSGAPR